MMIKEQKHASTLMPKSEAALKILQERAKVLAKEELDTSDNHGIPFVRFQLDENENYGIAYQYIQEIVHQPAMVLPPLVPNFVAGVINWRGALITVVDLIKFFHPQAAIPDEKRDKGYIMVVKSDTITLGLLAHHIEGSALYLPNQLSAPLSSAHVTNPEYILGLDQAVTAIINVESLLTSVSKEIKMRLYKTGDVHGN